MNPESLKSSFTDLVSLAEKVSQLNPDAGEIGAGMLRELVSLARRALGEEAGEVVVWSYGGDEYHLEPETGCEGCAFAFGSEGCRESPGCGGSVWVLS